jgi:pre-mRNA-splicing helicase BRR2
VPEVVARKLERKSDIEWSRYADLTPSDLGELVGVPKMGRKLHKLVQQFPRLELSANIQPITRSMIRVELILVPAFQFDVEVHGYVQLFHVIVEDVNGETILHHELFSLKSKGIEHEQTLVFTVPVLEPLPPAYFIRVISDRWLHSEATLPISFAQTILPAKFPPPTELLDLQPLPPSAIGEPTLAKLFHFKEFNPIQTQTFHELFKTDRNCLICAPSGSGKTVCAEFAVLRMFTAHPEGKCVYVAPTAEIAQPVFANWSERFGSLIGRSKIALLTGETAADLRLLGEAKVVISTVAHFDMLSRRWKQRKAMQSVSLFIFDELQFLGGELGPVMEVVISRMRYMSAQLKQDNENSFRIVGLGASLANAREVGEWMGVPTKNVFNFSPKVRPLPLEIYFQTYDQSNYSARLLAMAKPVYNAVTKHSDGKPTIVFVPSRRQAQLTAIDIMTYHESQGKGAFLAPARKEDISAIAAELREPGLQQVVPYGIGYLHGGMTDSDWATVVKLFCEGTIPVIVCPSDVSWKLQVTTHLVVIMGTEAYDGRERRYVDYPVVQLLHMLGRACRQSVDSNGKCVLLCHTPKKEYLKKLLFDPLPIESHLDHYLHDHFNSEIVTKTIETMQDAVDYVTWTFLYRRLPKNPNYYGLTGTSDVHISEHLSEMVETVLGDLEDSKCCQISEDGEVSPLNLGMIAAYYYVQYTTIELIASSVSAKTKIRGVLEIVAAASEFSTLPIRYGEEKALKILATSLTHKLPEAAQYHDPNTKALILLQCHFSRKLLSPDLRVDQKLVIRDSVNLIQAVVDVVSSNGWLKPALAAMELSQMVVQGLWNKDNVLKQIPHFTDEIVQRCADFKGEEPIESVFDILSLDEDVRNDILRLPDEKLADVAVFCNNYPNVEVTFEIVDADEVTTGDPVRISVRLKREVDEEPEEAELEALGKVSAPLFPGEKREAWWIVVGDTATNSLYSLKRVNLQLSQKIDLEFMAPDEAGDYNLKLFCMSDSYLGCDQEYDVPLSVAAGGDDNGDSDEE